jgi:hypothetical protein
MGRPGEEVFFVTLHKNGDMEIRPKGARAGDSTVIVTVKAIYERAMINRTRSEKPRRTRKVRRSSML